MGWVIITMAMVNGMVTAYWQTHSPSRLAWSEGWWPSSAQSTFIKWTGCTITVALSHDDSMYVLLCITDENACCLIKLNFILKIIFYSSNYILFCTKNSERNTAYKRDRYTSQQQCTQPWDIGRSYNTLFCYYWHCPQAKQSLCNCRASVCLS